VLSPGMVLIMIALIVGSHSFRRQSDWLIDVDMPNATVYRTEAASTAAPPTTIPSLSPFDEWARGERDD
jgi:hypothetical protein